MRIVETSTPDGTQAFSDNPPQLPTPTGVNLEMTVFFREGCDGATSSSLSLAGACISRFGLNLVRKQQQETSIYLDHPSNRRRKGLHQRPSAVHGGRHLQ